MEKSRIYYAGDDTQDRMSFGGIQGQPKNDMNSKNQHTPMSKKRLAEVEEYENKKLDLQLLLLDNYDSYTYNLYSYLCTMCKHKPIVVSNDAYATWEDLIKGLEGINIDGIVISPGPGRPDNKEDMGVCIEVSFDRNN